MRELLANQHQVVLFAHNFKKDCFHAQNPGCAPRIKSFFVYAVETPYTFRTVEALENTEHSCAEDRGSGNYEDFYSINSYITTTFGPSKSAASQINERDFIENRVKKCEELTGHKVNFYNIDFWQRGDLLSLTQEINLERGLQARKL